MSAELEMALLSLYANATDELGPEQLDQLGPEIRPRVGDTPPEAALELAAREVPPEGSVDQFAATQAFVLGVRVQQARGRSFEQLGGLGNALLGSVGLAASATASADLAAAIAQVAPRRAIPAEAIAALRAALGPALAVADGPAGQVAFQGPAARFAAMLVELAWNLPPRCRSTLATIDVGGKRKEVTLVEIDVCSDLPFDHLRDRVDPRNWPRCNPYFISVTPIVGPTPAADGWSGVIREVVGPGLNGRIYTTDLAVRHVQQRQLMAVAFDLADPDTPGAQVSVDRGFLSVTDEGARRRTRVLKVYRIEDLQVPHLWVCPLWAMQVALAGWWCR